MLSGILLGIAVGLIMGLTGAGGGILAVPALMYGMSLSMIHAKPIALIAVGLAALFGSIQGFRRGLLRYRAALAMALAGGLTAPLGVVAAEQLTATTTAFIYIAVMVLSGARMLIAKRELAAEQSPDSQPICPISGTSGRFIWTPLTTGILFGIGSLAGFFTGLLGVGGGFVIVPALLAVSNLLLASVVATSLMVITLNTIITLSLTLHDGIALTIPLWAFVLSTVIGLALGRYLASRVSEEMIRYGFSLLSFSVAVAMLIPLLRS